MKKKFSLFGILLLVIIQIGCVGDKSSGGGSDDLEAGPVEWDDRVVTTEEIENDGKKYQVRIEISYTNNAKGEVSLQVTENEALLISKPVPSWLWFPYDYKLLRLSFEQYSPQFGRMLFEAMGSNGRGQQGVRKVLLNENGGEDIRFVDLLDVSPSGNLILTDSTVVSAAGDVWRFPDFHPDFGYFITDSLFVYGTFDEDAGIYHGKIIGLSGREYHEFLGEFPCRWPKVSLPFVSVNEEAGYAGWLDNYLELFLLLDLKDPTKMYTYQFNALEMYDHPETGRPSITFECTNAVFYMGPDRKPQACWKPEKTPEPQAF